MPKRLVLCCDGTWNTPDQESDGQPCRTNVAKLAVAVADELEGLTAKRYWPYPTYGDMLFSV